MTTYTVTIKAVYMEEMTIIADDRDEAERIAMAEFKPDGDNLYTIDVYGLSPWEPDSPLEDILHDQYKQRELDERP